MFSKTMQASYLACVCPHCAAFAGDFFRPQFWHLADSTNVVHRGKFCLACERGFDF